MPETISNQYVRRIFEGARGRGQAVNSSHFGHTFRDSGMKPSAAVDTIGLPAHIGPVNQHKSEAGMAYRVKTYALWTMLVAFLGIGAWFSVM